MSKSVIKLGDIMVGEALTLTCTSLQTQHHAL